MEWDDCLSGSEQVQRARANERTQEIVVQWVGMEVVDPVRQSEWVHICCFAVRAAENPRRISLVEGEVQRQLGGSDCLVRRRTALLFTPDGGRSGLLRTLMLRKTPPWSATSAHP